MLRLKPVCGADAPIKSEHDDVVIVAIRLDRRASFALLTKPVCEADAPIKSEHDEIELSSPYDLIGGPPLRCV